MPPLPVDDRPYRRESVVDVDAAVVGVSAAYWTAAAPSDTEDDARTVMAARRFDVLPIGGEGGVRAFWATETWGHYDRLRREPVRFDDVVPERTPIDALIRAFATERRGRPFYFLAAEGRVTGLVTLGNLNCRQVRTFLFALVADLEIRLSYLLAHAVGDDEGRLMRYLPEEARARFERERQRGADAPLTEYFSFEDLRRAVADAELHEALGFADAAACGRALDEVRILRNAAAHPVKTLVRSPANAKTLWERVRLVERALFELRLDPRAAHP